MNRQEGSRSQSRASHTRWRALALCRHAFETLQPVVLSLPRGAGVVATIAIIGGSIAYGAVRGDHVTQAAAQFREARDALANAAGFNIADILLDGQKEIARDKILSLAGVNAASSLLFLDVDAVRERLKSNPWIAEATILKLYPDRLHISIVERTPFALWQKDGKISVVARDGTVVQPYADESNAMLPLVVGAGADKQALEFLTLLARYPLIRDQVRASILVADRRWNLKLNNGLDIRLPETGMAHAFETLLALDRDKKLLSRDIVSVDLRLPDRITVRLPDEAAQAREDALKERKAKKKGGDA
jgi:cell division protein FtsQ